MISTKSSSNTVSKPRAKLAARPKKQGKFVAYLLLCADDTLYAGSTNDFSKRLKAHNGLKSGAKYTRARRPVTLFYAEYFNTMTEAKKREAAYKKLSRTQKQKLRMVNG